ncbi:MAG: CocE/NonD family hydrolase [Anaerolineae bacterium]|nr:CocE/NonD family hydrolase [Anaerolineae bacterium]
MLHKTVSFRRTTLALILIGVLVLPLLAPAAAQDDDRVSSLGKYRGYSEPLYDDYVRISQYVPVRDGTRLAVDIFRPVADGVPVDDPLPVIWTHHRYHRADTDENGRVYSILDSVPALETLIEYGYVVAAVDVRGGGASFGTRPGEFTRIEAQDAYDMTEWFAEQPWCDGNIGMYGISYLGITQYMAASTRPPHLKAIFPQMAMFDMYSFVYPGGVFRDDFLTQWGFRTRMLDKSWPAAPVDDDPDLRLLEQAIEEHQDNVNIYTLALDQPYRDSTSGPANTMLHFEWSPASYIEEINQSGVAIYHLAGWYDMYPRAALTWFNNLTVPQKIIVTYWSHSGSGGFNLMTEHLRWFDYWLKDIDNGIMDEPPITYFVMGAPDGERWRTAEQWPLPDEQPTVYYFQPGPSDSIASVNDGLLGTEPPASAGFDPYTVDYSTTTGQTTRWTDGYGGGYGYPDMVTNDQKGLTYTTPPLDVDTEITGHPVAHLWISADAEDADVYVYLEEVEADGTSTYITEGVLRASHRATSEPPFAYMGLPYHRSFEEDIAPLTPGEPVELLIDLLPTSNIFDAGHRIRITITGADADNYATLGLDPPPTISLYLGGEKSSSVTLPVIPAE